MMPPSPSLSARMMTITYFSVTTRISDQNPSDSSPFTVAASGVSPKCGWNISLMVYSGLVPMSPNTTPIAPTTRPARPACACPGPECAPEAETDEDEPMAPMRVVGKGISEARISALCG